MSIAPEFPVYTVQGWDGRPCGHQHRSQERAENCALNSARAKIGKVFTVKKRHAPDTDSMEDGKSESVSHFEVKLVTT